MGIFTGVMCPHGSLPEINQVTVSHRVVDGGKRGEGQIGTLLLSAYGWKDAEGRGCGGRGRRMGVVICMFHDQETVSLKGFLFLSCQGSQSVDCQM